MFRTLPQVAPSAPEVGDRPRETPGTLAPSSIDLSSGIQIGIGPQYVTVLSDEMQLKNPPQPSFADGGTLSLDVVLGTWRLGYSKQFLRRPLITPVSYRGFSANFIGVDTDQFWAFYGWRPSISLYLGAGLGGEYRLIRLGSNFVNPTTQTVSTVDTRTVVEVQAVGAVLADWAFSPPFSLQVRYEQEEGGHLLEVDGLTFEIAYLVSF